MTAKRAASSGVTEEQVRTYLKAHPEFLQNNPEIIGAITLPERDLGNGIIDFQHYLLKALQQDSKALKSKYEVLIDFCRDNMSVQAQVHSAALKLISARSLDQLLEAVTLDMVSLFDVDVVRLAMESELAGQYEPKYGEDNYSGIVAIDPGTVDAALGHKKNVLLVADCGKARPAGFEEIFSDCTDLIASCALLRLELEHVSRNVVLAFGVRHKDRFHPGQGIELLHFLAQIVAHQLDITLQDAIE